MKHNNGVPKPTKTQQQKALQEIAEKMKSVTSSLKECEAIAEKHGVSFGMNLSGDWRSVTYYPKSPWQNGWMTGSYKEGEWDKEFEGWMSSTDECNA